MTARLRHSMARRRDGTLGLTIIPGDGRYPEDFRVRPAELRRFAWAVLADLDPAEAAIAAAEAGTLPIGLQHQDRGPVRFRRQRADA